MPATAGAAALQAVLTAGGSELAALMADVENRLGTLAGGHGALLARYAGDTIAAGGKRLRPLLVCLAAGEVVADRELLVRAATAIELIHAASLVHDDVLDRSPSAVADRRFSSPVDRRWPWPPGICCSPARSPSSRRAGRWRPCGSCPGRARASSPAS